jgi:hypothetical protein
MATKLPLMVVNKWRKRFADEKVTHNTIKVWKTNRNRSLGLLPSLSHGKSVCFVQAHVLQASDSDENLTPRLAQKS